MIALLHAYADAAHERELADAFRAAAPELTVVIATEVLPEIRSSSEIYGETAKGLFDAPLAIAGIAGDQQAALFGQNCFTRGLAKNTYGTGCFMLMNMGPKPAPSKHQLITTVAWQAGGPRLLDDAEMARVARRFAGYG